MLFPNIASVSEVSTNDENNHYIHEYVLIGKGAKCHMPIATVVGLGLRFLAEQLDEPVPYQAADGFSGAPAIACLSIATLLKILGLRRSILRYRSLNFVSQRIPTEWFSFGKYQPFIPHLYLLQPS